MHLPEKTKRKRHLREPICFAVLAIAVVGIVWVAFSGSPQTPPQTSQTSTSPTSTRTVAPDFTLTDIYGDQVRLSDHRGNVVLLEFMQTTCSLCVTEMAQLVSVQKAVNGVTMISVSVNPEGDTDAVLDNFMKTYGAPYSSKNQWLFARDTARVTRLYRISGVPTIIIIDANGYIVGVNNGEVSSETLIQQIELAQSY